MSISHRARTRQMRAVRIAIVVSVGVFLGGCGGAKDRGITDPGNDGGVSKLVVVSGDAQTDTVLSPLAAPLVVRAVDSHGNGLAGVPIVFMVSDGGGTVSPAAVTTDSGGRAQAQWTLGPVGGDMRVHAAVQDDVVVAATLHATVEWPPLRSVMLDVGYEHSCAVEPRLGLYCWGKNDVGQLGDGTTEDRLHAVPVQGGTSFHFVTAGGDGHTCALTSDGVAYCWGRNVWGQLGDGTTVPHGTPQPVYGDLRFTALSAGAEYTCGLTADGKVYCWGFMEGSSSTIPPTPILVSGTQQFQSIDAGDFQLCGIGTDGVTYCFHGTYTPDGINGGPGSVWRPVAVSTSLRFTSLTAGLMFTCGVTDAGVAYCWGMNTYGELGTGNTDSAAVPTAVAGDLRYRSLHAGYDWVCGITTAGTNSCWGHDSWGQLGFDDAAPSVHPSPESMPLPDGVTFTAMDGGLYHMCGIASTSLTYCWGGGFNGQLGDGRSAEFYSRPTPEVVRRRS
ncbi:MAG TPA: hypothetical protein VF041_04730 [Gemmatimonadaceae bacterium]